MRNQKSYPLSALFYERCLAWLNNFSVCSVLDSANYYKQDFKHQFAYHTFGKIIAVDFVSEIKVINNDSFESLKQYHNNVNDWLFGYLSYDLKNELERLTSTNPDLVNFPDIYFYQPRYIFIFHECNFDILYLTDISDEAAVDSLVNEISNYSIPEKPNKTEINIQSRFTKQMYLATVGKFINHIRHGDIYEVNFCQEFFANATIDPLETYQRLLAVSPMPFSCFFRLHNKYLLCASPERYLKKMDVKIISQPIKGTARRGKNIDDDRQIVNELIASEKERAENIMVVDLVRNDLSRTASKASVNVEELCGAYTFKQVHQLISTVVSELKPENHFIDVLKTTFPMGSMTGTPKISAMNLIEKYEQTKRGLYSGSVGYITPCGDFDFNVVIRSLLYNAETSYLSFSVGGAITALSVPENEYDECLIKAQAIMSILKS